MIPRRAPVPDILLEVGGVQAAIDGPADALAAVDQLIRGPRFALKAEPAVRYRLTDDGAGRCGLERDHLSLRHNAEPDAVARVLIADLIRVVPHRSPGTVLAHVGAVDIDGRGVIVLGPEGAGTSTFLEALVEAGATLVCDGLGAFDGNGNIHPVVVSGGSGPTNGSAPAPRPVTLVLSTAFDPDATWEPVEVVGARAVLSLLGAVVPDQQQTPAARSLLGVLAEQVVELRGTRPEAGGPAVEVVARAERLPVPHPPRRSIEGRGGVAAVPPPPPSARPARFLQLEDVLTPDEHGRLLEYALGLEPDLTPSEVISREPGDDVGLRRSQTSYALDDVLDLFGDRLVRLLPHVRRELGLDWFDLGRIEGQLTVHGDGDHFAFHIDNADPAVASRVVSAVYYFYREPRRFSGGELRLFDTVEREGWAEPADTFVDVDPADNTLVFFPSGAPHEVRPVRVPGDEFADRRFTVVLFFHRVTGGEEVAGQEAEHRECR